MAFNFFGVGEGLVKGLAYDVEFGRAVVWAITTANLEALAELATIAETNVKEIVGEAKSVSQSHAVALLFASDPFKGSRGLMQAFTAKHGAH